MRLIIHIQTNQIMMKHKSTGFSCPMPEFDFDTITLGHGSGGLLTNKWTLEMPNKPQIPLCPAEIPMVKGGCLSLCAGGCRLVWQDFHHGVVGTKKLCVFAFTSSCCLIVSDTDDHSENRRLGE